MTLPDVPQNPVNAQVGYQAAIALWTYEGNLIWSKFNAFLVANSIVLAAYGFSLGAGRLPRAFVIGLPVAGVILCALRATMTRRGFENGTYWIFSAREIEEKYLYPVVQTASRGGAFADGAEIGVVLAGENRKLRLSRTSRALRAAHGSYLTIAVFVLLYVLLLF